MTLLEKAGLYGSVVLMGILFFLIVFSENGLVDYFAIRQKEEAVRVQIQTVDHENQELEGAIHTLKTDMDYIRHLAKHEHDMIEADELVFKVRVDHPKERHQ